jgi:hypothetical protein
VRLTGDTATGQEEDSADKATTMVIDDAQHLSPVVLKRIAARLQGARRKDALRLLLVGTPDLLQHLDQSDDQALSRNAALRLRLGPLSRLESQRYVEHLLWLAGSSVRRIMSPAALRDIILRGQGNPEQLNLVLQAALNAGFARNEPSITPRVIRSAIGVAPRGPKKDATPRPPRDGSRLFLILSLIILAVGAGALGAAFWFDQDDRPMPHATARVDQLPAVTTPTLPRPPLPPPAPEVKLAPEAKPPTPPVAKPPVDRNLVNTLVRRGDEMVKSGDIGAARLLYQRAAEAGDAKAALAAGRTFDPDFLRQQRALGVAADPDRAAYWYRRATALGDPAAEALLRQLPVPDAAGKRAN